MAREASAPEICPLLGESSAIEGLRDFIVGVSLIHQPVLILGAKGTGKSLAARKIHAVGRTAQAPFIHVDCSTTDERDLEEILFDPCGDGVMTGVLHSKVGATCYLSHVESLSPLLERALLRHVLDHRNEGDRCTRLIFGSHYEYGDLAEGELIDPALFELISRYRTVIPPLRERVEDIPILCHYQLWLRMPNEKYPAAWESFQREMLPCLIHYPWPGNVDELNQLVRSYCDEQAHEALEEIGPELDAAEYLARQFRRWAQEFEREITSGQWKGWTEGDAEVTTDEEARWTCHG